MPVADLLNLGGRPSGLVPDALCSNPFDHDGQSKTLSRLASLHPLKVPITIIGKVVSYSEVFGANYDCIGTKKWYPFDWWAGLHPHSRFGLGKS